MIREACVRGKFYPSRAEDIDTLISRLKPTRKITPVDATGIILPHAGYTYSGKVAIHTVASVKPKRRLVILGPNHTGFGREFSLFPKGKWEIPGGTIPVDEDLAERILKSGEYIQKDTLAHLYEHSIEVELPIIKYFFGDFKFVPISCGVSTPAFYSRVATQIYEAIKDLKSEVLIVASSDMTHYEPDAVARQKDRQAIECITKLDEDCLLEKVKEENITMCGISPVTILIKCAKMLKAQKATVILYQTSGDSSGDYSSVVGYLGAVIH